MTKGDIIRVAALASEHPPVVEAKPDPVVIQNMTDDNFEAELARVQAALGKQRFGKSRLKGNGRVIVLGHGVKASLLHERRNRKRSVHFGEKG